ncbi:UNVERIFIED_CONTAM: hypothetical protein Sangu_1030400 [Sesamum angustifolium]|uniref:Uncharacterized protein n=1 Tax=Sesamum angustifolium TaxID=2727405 RepID=A0AAW2P051_9LAMI
MDSKVRCRQRGYNMESPYSAASRLLRGLYIELRTSKSGVRKGWALRRGPRKLGQKEVREAAGKECTRVAVNEVESEGTVHGLEQIELVPTTFQGPKFDTYMQVDNLATNNEGLELGLVQVPLRFVARGPMEPRTRGRRGRRGSVTSVVGAAENGIAVLASLILAPKGYKHAREEL